MVAVEGLACRLLGGACSHSGERGGQWTDFIDINLSVVNFI